MEETLKGLPRMPRAKDPMVSMSFTIRKSEAIRLREMALEGGVSLSSVIRPPVVAMLKKELDQ